MENPNNKEQNTQPGNTSPKPTDDIGAQIETVTPDTEKEGVPNDTKIPSPKKRDQDNKENTQTDKAQTEQPELEREEDVADENQASGQQKDQGDVPGNKMWKTINCCPPIHCI